MQAQARSRNSGNVWFLFTELLSSLRGRPLRGLLLALGVLVLFLSAVTFALLAQGQGAGGEVFALLAPGLAPEEIDRLYLQIRGWEEVAGVQLFLEEELRQGKRTVPLTPLPNGDLFAITLREPGDSAALQERLRGLNGVQQVIGYGRGPLIAVLDSSFGSVVCTAALALLGLGALLAVRGALGSAVRNWRGELRLLHLAGVSPRRLAQPFLLTGSLLGLLGAVIVWLAIYLVHLWGTGQPEPFYRTLPALLDPRPVFLLLPLELGLGLGIGLLGSAWAALRIRRL